MVIEASFVILKKGGFYIIEAQSHFSTSLFVGIFCCILGKIIKTFNNFSCNNIL
jgi:hypothetical protein